MSLRNLILVLVLLMPGAAMAAESAAPAAVPPFLAPGRAYNYRVQIRLNGQSRVPGTTDPQKIDAVLDLTVRQKSERSATPGEVQSVMTVQTASLTAGGEKIQLSPTTFPQVTVLIDKACSIKKIFGATGPGMPGLNFSNFMLLLLPNLPQCDPAAIKEGDQWTKQMAFSDTGQEIKVVSTYRGTEKVAGVDTLAVQQTFDMVHPKEDASDSDSLKTMSGTATSNYAVSDRRPIKSHAEIDVVGAYAASPSKTRAADTSAPEQDRGEFRAKLSIELTALK